MRWSIWVIELTLSAGAAALLRFADGAGVTESPKYLPILLR
jgi:hypothetical protein